MLNIPIAARAFAGLLLVVGLLLAVENTVISADVLAKASGANLAIAIAVAVVVTGLELTFASWLRQGKGVVTVTGQMRDKPVQTAGRLFLLGIGLALVYHFDLLTTALHPSFVDGERYFFGVIVVALVFGPEVCIVIASWLWLKARDVESRQIDQNAAKDAENMRLRTKRSKLVALANEAGEAEAIKTARQRWGSSDDYRIL